MGTARAAIQSLYCMWEHSYIILYCMEINLETMRFTSTTDNKLSGDICTSNAPWMIMSPFLRLLWQVCGIALSFTCGLTYCLN
jgi:hypothetical protein